MALLVGCGGDGSPATGEFDFDAVLRDDGAQSGSRTLSKGRPAFDGSVHVRPQVAAIAAEITAAAEGKIIPQDGAAKDTFGVSVAISGDTAIIGAIFDDDVGIDSGSVYVFVRSNGAWAQQAKLVADDGLQADKFGASVAIHNDTIIVGALAGGAETGAAYVFTRSNGVWTQAAKLLPADGVAGDQFGYAVALANGVAIVGSPQTDDLAMDSGSAYIFRQAGLAWTEETKIVPSVGGTEGFFGSALSLSGTTAIVGAWDDGSGADAGQTFVYAYNGTAWAEQAILIPDDAAAGATFGFSVALSGDTALIGAIKDDANAIDSGSAYVFSRAGSTWTQETKIVPANPVANANFGSSVALWNDMATIGAYWDSTNGQFAGAAYAYIKENGVWTEKYKYMPTDSIDGQLFGSAAALDNDLAIVGAYGDDDNGGDSGSVYAFSVLQKPDFCAPDDATCGNVIPPDPSFQCSAHGSSGTNNAGLFMGLGIALLGLRRKRHRAGGLAASAARINSR